MIKQAQETLDNFYNTRSVVCAYFTIANEFCGSERFKKQYSDAVKMLELAFKNVPITVDETNAVVYKRIDGYRYFPDGLLLMSGQGISMAYADRRASLVISPYDSSKVEKEQAEKTEAIYQKFLEEQRKKNTLKEQRVDKDGLIHSLSTIARLDPIINFQVAKMLGRKTGKLAILRTHAPLYELYDILTYVNTTMNVAAYTDTVSGDKIGAIERTYSKQLNQVWEFLDKMAHPYVLSQNNKNKGFYYLQTRDSVRHFIDDVLKAPLAPSVGKWYYYHSSHIKRDTLMTTAEEKESIQLKTVRMDDRYMFSCGLKGIAYRDKLLAAACVCYQKLKAFVLDKNTPEDVKEFFVVNGFIRQEEIDKDGN